MKKSIYLLIAILSFAIFASAQSDADKEAIRACALNYVEGWYEGDAARMESALHPELAKRMFSKDEKGRSQFNHMGAMRLVQGTRAGYGKNTPKDQQVKEVKILDIFENVASARADMKDWIDYMHLAKVDGKWVIVNVLWEYRQKKKE